MSSKVINTINFLFFNVNTWPTDIDLQNFVVSQLHGLVARQDVKVDPTVHPKNGLWRQGR